MKEKKQGFTLVELIATIVILALIVGIVIVVCTGVINLSKKKSYAATRKNIIEAAKAYVTEYGDYLVEDCDEDEDGRNICIINVTVQDLIDAGYFDASILDKLIENDDGNGVQVTIETWITLTRDSIIGETISASVVVPKPSPSASSKPSFPSSPSLPSSPSKPSSPSEPSKPLFPSEPSLPSGYNYKVYLKYQFLDINPYPNKYYACKDQLNDVFNTTQWKTITYKTEEISREEFNKIWENGTDEDGMQICYDYNIFKKTGYNPIFDCSSATVTGAHFHFSKGSVEVKCVYSQCSKYDRCVAID